MQQCTRQYKDSTLPTVPTSLCRLLIKPPPACFNSPSATRNPLNTASDDNRNPASTWTEEEHGCHQSSSFTRELSTPPPGRLLSRFLCSACAGRRLPNMSTQHARHTSALPAHERMAQIKSGTSNIHSNIVDSTSLLSRSGPQMAFRN